MSLEKFDQNIEQKEQNQKLLEKKERTLEQIKEILGKLPSNLTTLTVTQLEEYLKNVKTIKNQINEEQFKSLDIPSQNPNELEKILDQIIKSEKQLISNIKTYLAKRDNTIYQQIVQNLQQNHFNDDQLSQILVLLEEHEQDAIPFDQLRQAVINSQKETD